MSRYCLLILLCCSVGPRSQGAASPSGPKPIVWIYTDMSDKTLRGGERGGTVNDPDDISAMAGYLLMANEFDTRGIVVASTHRKEHAATPNQAEWADEYFGKAYAADRVGLNGGIGGFPERVVFHESGIKKNAERFDPDRDYRTLQKYRTVQLLLDEAEKTEATINVLCWGSLTEPAILVKHLVTTQRADVLDKLRFIGHWTDSPLHQGSLERPENVANCREDARACAFMKEMAGQGRIAYFECGAIGQHGIVRGGPKGREYFDSFRSSRLGTIFVDGKFVYNGVDHSDSATYWVLLGGWGVGLEDLASDGRNSVEVERANEKKFREASKRIHAELLRRSDIAAIE